MVYDLSFGNKQPSPLSFERPYIPDFDKINDMLNKVPPDPMEDLRPRPTTEVLLKRKQQIMEFWRPRNLRMAEDHQIWERSMPVEDRVGGDEVGASETIVGNDPYVLCEKVANMMTAADLNIESVYEDPGMKDIAQKVENMIRWWDDEANDRWAGNLNNSLKRDEIYYLALRGWVCGRIMLDPGDPDFPWRYDLIDPMQVYPQKGPKEPRWVFHVYRDSKVNVLNDLGWRNDLLQRVEAKLGSCEDIADVEVASYYDDVWHVMFINEEEIWSAAHNYGFVPWVFGIAFGSPSRRVDPVSTASETGSLEAKLSSTFRSNNFTKYWGVSIFEGIKEVYQKMNKLASAIMTEAMKAPNPPVVLYTNKMGEVESKILDSSAGAVNYLVMGQEDFKILEYGFKPSELAPLMQLLTEQRNRGSMPSVMYGEGANYLSGFAVSLLQAGSRDVILPLIDSHQRFKQNLFNKILRMTAEIYPFPIQMVSTDPSSGNRTRITTITGDDIKLVGYRTRVRYKNVMPADKQGAMQMAIAGVNSKLLSLDTARGEEFVGLKNPTLENKKVLGDLAYYDPEVVKAAIPYGLLQTDPTMYLIYMEAQMKRMRDEMMQMQMMMQMAPQMNKQNNESQSAKPSHAPKGPGGDVTNFSFTPLGPTGEKRPPGAERIANPPY